MYEFRTIVNSMLLAMGEKPGESKLGKVLMLVVTMAVMVGGAGLMSGSPIGISSCLAYMNEAIGYDCAPSFIQWACICMPTLIICIAPVTYVYIIWFKVKNEEFTVLPSTYYNERLAELGPMQSAEWRWIIILCGMVLSLLLGMKAAFAAPICVGLGYNPTLVLPAAMGASYIWVLGANQYVMMNKEYGWWEVKETIVPG